MKTWLVTADHEYDTVVLSPHPDDAVFSLGGAMLKGILGKILIVNVFTRSAYVVDEVASDVEVTELRRAEDLKAVASLGCKSVYMELPDSSLKDCYRTEADYMDRNADIHADPCWEAARIGVLEMLQGLNYGLALFPLGLGGHVEHRILKEIGLEAADRGIPTAFYEDAAYYLDHSTELTDLVEEFERCIRLKTASLEEKQC
jgi:LmbE family N-acetylglucosaminyl deacetylase